MKRAVKGSIILVVVVAVLVLAFSFFENKPAVEHVNSTDSVTKDCSQQAQIYFEYLGTYLKDRTGVFSDHKAAQQFIVDELKLAGYSEDEITLQKIEGRSGKNIVLKVEGDDPTKSVIVGAHFDGDGVGDNGSGTALLLAEACSLQGEQLPVTTYYVFFDEEESGGYGSESFANSLSEDEAESVIYMINMDAIAFGDYCNIYGGKQDSVTKEISQTEGYEYACKVAKQLGFHVYGPDELSGYYAEHGKGPELDPIGIFTNPWTPEHPAPENTVEDAMRAYSPTTIPASDHVPFVQRDIPYIYFEATNWYVKTDYEDMAYIGYTDVADEHVGDKGIIMNTRYDTLETMNTYYPGRSLEHFRLYAPILSELILHPMGYGNSYVSDAQEATTHKEEWIKDLEIIREAYPKRAKGFFDHWSEEAWNAGIDELEQDIQMDRLSDLYITYRINGLLAKAKILHVSFQCGYMPQEQYFPIIPRRTEDGIYYLEGAAKQYEPYLGCEIKDINGHECEEIGEALDTIHPSENVRQVEIMYAVCGISKDEMAYLGLSNQESDYMTVVTREGNEEKVALNVALNPNEVEWVHDNDRFNGAWVSRSMPKGAYHGFWYNLDEENRVFYFNYSEAQDAETNHDSSMTYFRDFAKDMAEKMTELNDAYDKIVIDLRYNHGGDSELINVYLLRPYRELFADKKMYVLIGEQTFSAGLNAANDLDEAYDVVFIGQETGGIVGGYTNQQYVPLPNTKSCYGFCRSKAMYPTLELREKQVIGRGIIPDILISDTLADVSSGLDLAYEKVIDTPNVVTADFSKYFGDVNGCAVLYDSVFNEYQVYNEDLAYKQISPYSTFKIIATLMGLHNGVLENAYSKMNYDGTIYPNDSWNKDVTLGEAFDSSCIWYFKKVIEAIGKDEVQEELNTLSYGNCDVSEWNGSGINPMDDLNGFWLGSSLKISPMEQVRVMKDIFCDGRFFSEQEIGTLQDVMTYDEVNRHAILGKTGTNRNQEGWYVGFITKEEEKWCFAVYIRSDEASSCVATGNEAREIIKRIFESL
ncbi:MAG: penicillin-binding transpeptidase domain-containing protein [bacterium]|nr:penicillin-binding transpeptidase domain-containing protein [bacterium]